MEFQATNTAPVPGIILVCRLNEIWRQPFIAERLRRQGASLALSSDEKLARGIVGGI